MTDRLARRRWSLVEKQAIVAQCAAPGASVSAVARQHGVATSQLFAWRRRYGDGPVHGAPGKRAAGQDFAAVMVLPETTGGGGEARLELVLCNGSQLIASGGVPSATLVEAIKAMQAA
jgi:transposase-like protein